MQHISLLCSVMHSNALLYIACDACDAQHRSGPYIAALQLRCCFAMNLPQGYGYVSADMQLLHSSICFAAEAAAAPIEQRCLASATHRIATLFIATLLLRSFTCLRICTGPTGPA